MSFMRWLFGPPPRKTVCAYCKKTMRNGVLDKDGNYSHGICRKCDKEQRVELEKLKEKKK